MKTKLRIIIEYEADPKWYDTDDPVEMAAIDLQNFKNDPASFCNLLNEEDIKINVEPA